MRTSRVTAIRKLAASRSDSVVSADIDDAANPTRHAQQRPKWLVSFWIHLRHWVPRN